MTLFYLKCEDGHLQECTDLACLSSIIQENQISTFVPLFYLKCEDGTLQECDNLNSLKILSKNDSGFASAEMSNFPRFYIKQQDGSLLEQGHGIFSSNISFEEEKEEVDLFEQNIQKESQQFETRIESIGSENDEMGLLMMQSLEISPNPLLLANQTSMVDDSVIPGPPITSPLVGITDSYEPRSSFTINTTNPSSSSSSSSSKHIQSSQKEKSSPSSFRMPNVSSMVTSLTSDSNAYQDLDNTL
mmetsp:Transcript_24754/g.29219  ORF Transcript_24754/g.29219 Transcript_24754/m.29219 type:complete len:245 (-) Transcript_24754:21-755(-)